MTTFQPITPSAMSALTTTHAPTKPRADAKPLIKKQSVKPRFVKPPIKKQKPEMDFVKSLKRLVSSREALFVVGLSHFDNNRNLWELSLFDNFINKHQRRKLSNFSQWLKLNQFGRISLATPFFGVFRKTNKIKLPKTGERMVKPFPQIEGKVIKALLKLRMALIPPTASGCLNKIKRGAS